MFAAVGSRRDLRAPVVTNAFRISGSCTFHLPEPSAACVSTLTPTLGMLTLTGQIKQLGAFADCTKNILRAVASERDLKIFNPFWPTSLREQHWLLLCIVRRWPSRVNHDYDIRHCKARLRSGEDFREVHGRHVDDNLLYNPHTHEVNTLSIRRITLMPLLLPALPYWRLGRGLRNTIPGVWYIHHLLYT